ncbi:hypothetical protein OIU79_011300, partial [Salix purpurea]
MNRLTFFISFTKEKVKSPALWRNMNRLILLIKTIKKVGLMMEQTLTCPLVASVFVSLMVSAFFVQSWSLCKHGHLSF